MSRRIAIFKCARNKQLLHENGVLMYREGIPVLQAIRVDDSFVVWCQHCERWHIHGDQNGHRVAHCGDCLTVRGRKAKRVPGDARTGSYRPRGYYIQVYDEEPEPARA